MSSRIGQNRWTQSRGFDRSNGKPASLAAAAADAVEAPTISPIAPAIR